MLPVSAAFFQQEQARAAKQHNALVKGKSSEDLAVVEKQGNPDSSLVPHLGKAAFVDSSGVGDKHYAIAESILEAERAKHPNWMQQKYKQFEAEHGQLQQEECDSETEDGPNDGEVLCQCPIDLCARDAERLDDFDTWFDQIKNVLRIFRNSRKTKGFAPDHPMITVRATSNVNELRCGDIVYLLGKVGFSPFDATIVKLKLERFGTNAEPSWVARMHATDEGLPDVISLDLFLKYCCDTFDCEEQQVQILQYCGRRFGELDILSMESCEQVSQRIAPAPVTVDEDVEEDDRAVKIRSDLLKKALGAGKDKQAKKPKGAAKPKPKGVKKKTKDDVQKSKQSQRAGKDSGPADAEDVGDIRAEDHEEPGMAGAIHDAIETEWASALEADLPQAPSQAASSSSSSSTSRRPSGDPSPPPAPPGQPAPDNVLPWKNPQGYCFLPKDGKQMGVALGAGLRYSATMSQ